MASSWNKTLLIRTYLDPRFSNVFYTAEPPRLAMVKDGAFYGNLFNVLKDEDKMVTKEMQDKFFIFDVINGEK